MSAGDRDTLTDEEREALREASSVHSGDMKFWGHHLHAAVERIVVARVRAAKAQGWKEGAETVYEGWSEAEGPFLDDVQDYFPNPYESDD